MYHGVIMRPEQYAAAALTGRLRTQKVATLQELQSALGCQGESTVFRKLKALSYLSSYSHAGKYYTLPEIAQFDDRGLWSWKKTIHFSQQRTLKRTIEHWVAASPSGYFEPELERGLQVTVRGTVLRLLHEGRIDREKVAGRYLYGSSDPATRLRQTTTRQNALQAGHEPPGPEVLHHEMKAAIVLFFSQLNEQQRRLYAGLESLKLGRGGDQKIADLLGVDPHTIAKGREALLKRDIAIERIRRAGGGRPPLEKKHRNPQIDRAGHGLRHRGRPDDRPQVDAQNDREDQRAIECRGDRGLPPDRRAFAQEDGLRAARQSQEKDHRLERAP